jgi:N-acetylneuraminic acid mutarotase
MHVGRINPGTCIFDWNTVYVFGGRDGRQTYFFDTVERYNADLNMWTFLEIRMPLPLSNTFAFPIKKDYILILGGSGMKSTIDKDCKSDEQTINSSVLLYQLTKDSWFKLKPLPSGSKLCHA